MTAPAVDVDVEELMRHVLLCRIPQCQNEAIWLIRMKCNDCRGKYRAILCGIHKDTVVLGLNVVLRCCIPNSDQLKIIKIHRL